MATDFSSVDVLTMAVSAAGMLRSSGDPETALANAYAALGIQPAEASTPLPVRIVQLILEAGPDRNRLFDYLRRIEGPLSWDRPPTRPDQRVDLAQEGEEARRYAELLSRGRAGPGHSLFWRGDAYPYFSSFRLLERSSVLYFHGPTAVLRNGQPRRPPRRKRVMSGVASRSNCRQK